MSANIKIRPGLGKPVSPKSSATTDATSTVSKPRAPKTLKGPTPGQLVPGSATTKALFHVWRGDECVSVDSPPGAGKTSLVVTVVEHLVTNAKLKVLVAMPTRAQALAAARRQVTELPVAQLHIDIKDVEPEEFPPGYDHRSLPSPTPQATYTTLARAKFIARDAYDVMIVDEAYQATHALVAQASAGIPQILMVGDPGQIGPVVTIDTSVWAGHKDAPHLPAPLVTKGYGEVVRLSIDTTYRLGAETARVIAPIYKFGFASGRPDRTAVTANGETVREITAVHVADSANVDDVECMAAMVAHAATFVGGNIIEGETDTPIRAEDIAIVVSRNSQVSILTGMAANLGHEFTIGTADRMQGGEWPIVLALDPMYASDEVSEHNQSVGRLCVMVSRHTTHLTWFHDNAWLENTKGRDHDSKVHRQVRKGLVAHDVPDVDDERNVNPFG
jgi:hypothetical protein